MYKDPEKQRKAVREAVQRYRARQKGITPKVLHLEDADVIPDEDCNTQDVIPSTNPMMKGYEPPR